MWVAEKYVNQNTSNMLERTRIKLNGKGDRERKKNWKEFQSEKERRLSYK